MVSQRFARTLEHVRQVKQIRWLLPGWVFYEYYKLHKLKGASRAKSFTHGAKAEAIRLMAMASLPVPGTYELTTTGLALLKQKLEQNELAQFTLKSVRDFIPVHLKKKEISLEKSADGKEPYLKIFSRRGKMYFKLFYRGKGKE